MLLNLLGSICAQIRRFSGDKSGSVAVDFIVSIPILLAVLVLTSEYGRVLQAQTTLDNAVADATRFLSRAPTNAAGTGFDTVIEEQAQRLITERMNTQFISISPASLSAVEPNGFNVVSLSAVVGVTSPALSLMSSGSSNLSDLEEIEGLLISASDTIRHFGR